MVHNPEKNSPVKVDMERIKQGLSEHQMQKIKYECELLKKSIQELFNMAPHLFNEGVTSANTAFTSEVEEVKEEEPMGFTPSEHATNPYGGYYMDYDDMG